MAKNNEELEIIELEDDEGGIIHCVALGTFDVEEYNKMYCAFVEIDEAGNEYEDIIILEAKFADETKEMLDLVPVKNEEELETAYQKFLELAGEYELTDEDE